MPVAPDDFHRAQGADGIARQPHFAVRAGSDGTDQCVVGNPPVGQGRRVGWLGGGILHWPVFIARFEAHHKFVILTAA